MKRHTLIAVAAVLVFAAAAGASSGAGAIRWFSQRISVTAGHPMVWRDGSGQVPGPIVVWFAWDESNRRTCLAIVRDLASGQTFAPTAVDAGSCAVSR